MIGRDGVLKVWDSGDEDDDNDSVRQVSDQVRCRRDNGVLLVGGGCKYIKLARGCGSEASMVTMTVGRWLYIIYNIF